MVLQQSQKFPIGLGLSWLLCGVAQGRRLKDPFETVPRKAGYTSHFVALSGDTVPGTGHHQAEQNAVWALGEGLLASIYILV